MILLYFFLFLVIFTVILYEVSFIWGVFTATAPFVPIHQNFLFEIVKALQIKEGDTVYDLGCGDGRALAACYKFEPNASYIGIERNFFVWLLAKKRFWLLGNSRNISILRKNFFREDLTAATHIFTYLFPKPMNELLLKFQRDLMPGTRVVSCDFILKEKKPVEIIDLYRSKNKLAHKLYVYEF